MDGDEEGWSMWRNHILSEIKRINTNVEKLADSDIEIRIDVSKLKLVAAILGGASGIAGSVVAVVFITMVG